jgi:hypothetical protein
MLLGKAIDVEARLNHTLHPLAPGTRLVRQVQNVPE